MTEFGDIEPEDSWHPDDAVPILVDNLLRRLDLLDKRRDTTRRAELLDEIERRASTYRRDLLSDRDRLRLDQLLADLAHVRARNG